MKRHDWMTNKSPSIMYRYAASMAGKIKHRQFDSWLERKLRLFSVACCRRMWNRIDLPQIGNGIVEAERKAEGCVAQSLVASSVATLANYYGSDRVRNAIVFAVQRAMGNDLGRLWSSEAIREVLPGETIPQAIILRDMFGGLDQKSADPFNSFRTPMVLDLAEAAYKERNPDGSLQMDRLSILADCLEDAGFMDEGSLWNLRGYRMCHGCAGEKGWKSCQVCNPKGVGWDQWKPWIKKDVSYYRGFWVLDLILGK